jgi:DNA-binding winged helix-turn-helix (wHTH) protein
MYALGPFRLDAEAEILFRNGEPLPIGKRAVALLRVLVEQAGAPVSKDALLEEAWVGLVVEESNLSVQIAAIRKVLSQEPGGERWIETLPRRGYRFVGPVDIADPAPIATISSIPPAADVTPSQGGPAQLPPTTRMEPERRQLTIAYCELICPSDSALDVEDLADVIATYRRIVTDTARRCNGSIGEQMGNVVVAHFGHPAAHEDDAEQAVQAGLGLRAPVKELAAEVSWALSFRVGIATGLVVVNDTVDVREPQEGGIVGEAPTVAGRLLGLAKPDTVVIDAATRRLIGDLFSCRDLGPVAPVNMAVSTQAYQVLGPSAINNRFEALRGAKPAPLVGRDEELEILRRRWAQARSGEGRVVLVVGEPGIGKSRLTRALLEQLQAKPHTPLQYDCSPYHQDSALHPIISQLLRVTGIEHDDAPDQKLGKLKAVLGPITNNHNETVALLAPLLSIPLGPEYAPLDLSPPRRKELTLMALLGQLTALADNQPVLMIVEDAHWIDPTSLEFLSLAIERIGSLSVLLVMTARPGFAAPWPSYTYVSTLTLNRLSRHEGEALILSITGGKALPPEVLNQIIAHTDGVPLFVEELTKTVLESGLLEDAEERYILSGPLPARAIPSTLHGSLLARLDRLVAVKDVAQTAATIGREFSYALIAAVAGLPERDLRAALAQLVAAELVFERGKPPDARYLFKHALVRDAAYATMLKSRLRHLHARIAEAIERLRPEATKSEPELLAWHCTRAGQAGPAVGYWRRAGEQSVARYANHEAIGHFERALEQIGLLAPGEERDRLEADVRLAQAVPLVAVHGYGAQEVEFCASRAKELGDSRPGWAGHFAVHRLVWNSHMLRHPMPRTIALARDLLSFAERNGDPAQTAVACRALGFSLLFAGELVEADAVLARGAMHADGVNAADFTAYGENPSILCRLGGGWVRSLMGCPDTALCMIGEGLARARASGNPHPVSWALGILAVAHKLRCDAASTQRAAVEAVEVAGQHGLPQWLGFAELWLGWALGQLGQRAEGLALLQVAQRRLRDTGAILFTVMSHSVLAEAGLLASRPQTALEHLAKAQEHAEHYGEAFMLAEVHRLHAKALCALNAPASEREGRLRTALDIAQRRGAKVWELRAAIDLARLWRDQDRVTHAHDLLAPVHASFTEGSDLPDLTEARLLLDELDTAAD